MTFTEPNMGRGRLPVPRQTQAGSPERPGSPQRREPPTPLGRGPFALSGRRAGQLQTVISAPGLGRGAHISLEER